MGSDFNRLCMHSGGDYYVFGGQHSTPDGGGGKYFPSFSHIASMPDASGKYPWKLKGWAWAGMQAGAYGPTWRWCSVLQKSKNNPYSTQMTFSYPINYFNGTVSPTGAPLNVNYDTVPTTVTQLSTVPSGFGGVGLKMCYPSSYQGVDSYMNIIAGCDETWAIPSTMPYYSWMFSYHLPGGEPLLLESSYSIWNYIWENTGPYPQYLSMSRNMDCTGQAGGNKGKNYSMIGGLPAPSDWSYWPNMGTGGKYEWVIELMVDDALCIPTNVVSSIPNYNFDVGTATVTPNLSSGQFTMQAMYQSHAQSGHTYGLLASMPALSSPVVYGHNKYRLPGWDVMTDFFASLWTVWTATVLPGYYWGTVGGHSIKLPVGNVPSLVGSEVTFFGFDTVQGPPTAGYTVTYF